MSQKSKLKIIGELLSDVISEFGGSWRYLIIFSGFTFAWIIWNTWEIVANFHFDSPPFVLLNLVLAFIASIQAPILMMSQNRQGEKDRELLRKDYEMGKEVVKELQLMNMKLAEFNQLLKAQRKGKRKTNVKTLGIVQKEDLED